MVDVSTGRKKFLLLLKINNLQAAVVGPCPHHFAEKAVRRKTNNGLNVDMLFKVAKSNQSKAHTMCHNHIATTSTHTHTSRGIYSATAMNNKSLGAHHAVAVSQALKPETRNKQTPTDALCPPRNGRRVHSIHTISTTYHMARCRHWRAYTADLSRSSNQGWLMAALAEIRFAGSNASICFSKSRPASSSDGT